MPTPHAVHVHPGALAALARRLDEVAYRLQRRPTFPGERRHLVEALLLDAARVQGPGIGSSRSCSRADRRVGRCGGLPSQAHRESLTTPGGRDATLSPRAGESGAGGG